MERMARIDSTSKHPGTFSVRKNRGRDNARYHPPPTSECLQPHSRSGPNPSHTRPSMALTVHMGSAGNSVGELAAVRQFVQLVGEYHLNTTWIVDHARQLSWVATLRPSSTRHDLALSTTWATPELSIGDFQRRFRERWRWCRQVGIVPATVYCTESELSRPRMSLLAQFGLTTCIVGRSADAGPEAAPSGSPDGLPRPLPWDCGNCRFRRGSLAGPLGCIDVRHGDFQTPEASFRPGLGCTYSLVPSK